MATDNRVKIKMDFTKVLILNLGGYQSACIHVTEITDITPIILEKIVTLTVNASESFLNQISNLKGTAEILQILMIT